MNSSINSIGSQIVDNNEAKFHAGLYHSIWTEMTDTDCVSLELLEVKSLVNICSLLSLSWLLLNM